MKIIYINKESEIMPNEIEEIARGIKNGKIAIFPTETVYGIGTNAMDENACSKIFEIKRRDKKKPLIVLVSNKRMLEDIVEEINEIEKKLIEKFWPGPLTIIFKKKAIISDLISGGKEEIGVRMTSGKITHLLIETSGVPIVAPSANLSGNPTGIMPDKIRDELGLKVDYMVDCGEISSNLTSTVVKVEENKIRIFREGKISKEELKEIAEIIV